MTLLSKLARYAWLLALPLLWWALRGVPAREIWGVVQHLSVVQILILILLNVAIVGLMSSRWWVFLRTLGHDLPYRELVKYRLAAFGVSYFTPGPQFGGEPLQVYAARQRHQVPTSSAVASVSLDKLFELFANFTFLAAGAGIVLGSARPGGQSQFVILPLIGLSIIALVGYILTLRTERRPLSMLADWASMRFDSNRWRQALQEAVAAEEKMACISRWKTPVLVQGLILSGAVWVAMIGEYWLALRFLGLNLDFIQTMTLLISARLAFLSPSPGGLGTLEAGQVLAMSALGFEPAIGIGISLLIRARDVLLGLVGLWVGSGILRRHTKTPLAPQAGD